MRTPAIAVGLVVAGILLPLWPLCALGVVLAALSGRWLLSLSLGLFLDVLWGVPPSGILHPLMAPVTLLALGSIALWAWGRKSLFNRTLPEHL